MRRELHRQCCDGRCTTGLPCPAFAPGVLAHHRMPLGRRVWRFLGRLLAWLGGEHP